MIVARGCARRASGALAVIVRLDGQVFRTPLGELVVERCSVDGISISDHISRVRFGCECRAAGGAN